MSDIDRKSDKKYANSSPEDFVHLACYIDKETIINKNGEILQTIKFEGIQSEKISLQLNKIRKLLRLSISKHLSNPKFAIWFHTIRTKADIDDKTKYKDPFAQKIHDFWAKKNYWDDKYTNSLYVTIVHMPLNFEINKVNNFFSFLGSNNLQEYHTKYIEQAKADLNNAVNAILADMVDLYPRKLAIEIREGKCYSPHLELFKYVTYLKLEQHELTTEDLSHSWQNIRYTLGNYKIQVSSEDSNRYCSLVSIKEYPETPEYLIDELLQVPIEMVITEVAYIISQEQVAKNFTDQQEILKLTEDEKLQEAKNLDIYFDKNLQNKYSFCMHQLMINIISDDHNNLDDYIYIVSKHLSKMGILHVKEDVMLAHGFWAQIPGNFNLLHRLKPNSLNYIGGFTSLHNMSYGYQFNPWGRAITLLRTNKGTPFFFNFHAGGASGHTCILGNPGTGKTIMVNFLLSEASKFSPTVLYLGCGKKSEIFVKSKNFKWNLISSMPYVLKQDERESYKEEINDNYDLKIINPFLLDDKNLIYDFFKILSGHYTEALSREDLKLLQDIANNLLTLPREQRKIANLSHLIDFSKSEYDNLVKRLKPFLAGGRYENIFDTNDDIKINNEEINYFDFSEFTEKFFKKYNYPVDLKKRLEYFDDLQVFHSIKSLMIIYLIKRLKASIASSKKPFIIVFNPIMLLCNNPYFEDFLPQLMDEVTELNGITLSAIDIFDKVDEDTAGIKTNFLKNIDTRVILPSDAVGSSLQEQLELNREEFQAFKSILSHTRMFITKQKKNLVITELSIAGFPKLMKYLASDQDMINQMQASKDKNKWFKELYEAIDKQ